MKKPRNVDIQGRRSFKEGGNISVGPFSLLDSQVGKALIKSSGGPGSNQFDLSLFLSSCYNSNVNQLIIFLLSCKDLDVK